MPTDFWFRFSTYLSLVLACLCLGYAEWQFLPEVTAFTAVVIVLLAVSFFLDRRFELSLAKANALGLGIGIVAAVWMAWHLTNPAKTGPLADIDWPTNMLPLIGPLLMSLVPAKLFRPKHVGDWWAMHGVAVAGVALASSMTDDAPFVVLLAAYAVCSAWALVLFFYRRSGGFIPPIPNRPAPPPAQLAPADPARRPPRWVFARTLLWLGGGAVVAVLLFVTLPRSAGLTWVFTRKQYITGESVDARLVMNKSGELSESDEVAFKVTATDTDDNPTTDLDPDQHWRGREFVAYATDTVKRESSWAIQHTDLTYLSAGGMGTSRATDFGPGGATLRFELTPSVKNPVVASPVRWTANQTPVQQDGGKALLIRSNAAAMLWPVRERLDSYTQAIGPGTPPPPYRQPAPDDRPGPAAPAELSTPFELITTAGLSPLKQNSPDPYFREYARRLLAQLNADGGLTPPVTLNEREQVPDDQHERVALAFARHFRESDEFTYTVNLEAKDRKIDPLVDFLQNSKAGHCEWFAGSLALVLRAVGVPCQLVLGYRGWEVDEDGSTMVVRQRHAHAWVEVLVSRPAPPDFPFRPQTAPAMRDRVWMWLTVDPTPGTSAAPAAPKNWLEQGADLITSFLLRFDKEKQEKAVEELKQTALAVWPWAAGGAAVVLVGWYGVRWWRRRLARGPAFDGPDWYARFQAVLAARGFARTPGQTPREFADATAEARPAVADVIQFVTSKLYRVRYAGTPLQPDEVQQVTTALDQLEQKLAG